jgi:hypothetical protein
MANSRLGPRRRPLVGASGWLSGTGQPFLGASGPGVR